MEARSGRKLPGLPESENEYWEHAKVETVKMETVPPCEHNFEMVHSREIKCGRCGMGMYLDYRDKFEDGHLYRDGKEII